VITSIYYERYDPTVFWEAGKLASIFMHVEIILTQDTQVYFKTFSGMKIS